MVANLRGQIVIDSHEQLSLCCARYRVVRLSSQSLHTRQRL